MIFREEPLKRPLVTRSKLTRDPVSLGLRPGDLIMLHASARATGWAVGGPDVVIQAILDVIGPKGTLMMYAGWEETSYITIALEEDGGKVYFAECPPFGPKRSRANRR